MRQVILYPGEDGYWVVECPSLPGCVSQGENKAKAVANIREAIVRIRCSFRRRRPPSPRRPV